MSAPQIHLALNHFPLVMVVIGTVVLTVAVLLRNSTVRNTGLMILVGAGLSALPVFFSGEPAEEVMEKRPGISKEFIHEHEEAGEAALVMALIAGIAAAASFFVLGKSAPGKLEKPLVLATLGLSLLSVAALARASHLGGLIQHDELRQ